MRASAVLIEAHLLCNLVQPLLDVIEGLQVCDIVNDYDAVGTTIVAGGDRSESFLTGSVPLFHKHASKKIQNSKNIHILQSAT